jgi:hypothetical protein
MDSPRHTRQVSGWKEIASYLGVSVRKAQMLENEQALPVNRRGVGPKSPVYAVAEELDTWKSRRTSTTEPGREQSEQTRPTRRRWIRAAISGGAAVAGLAGLAARGSSQSFSDGEKRARHLNCAERKWSIGVV